MYDVDELGLDRLDRSVLSALCRSFGGGPVGLTTLAVAVGEEPTTVEEVCEPFLVRVGMLARTPRAGSRRRRPGRTSGWTQGWRGDSGRPRPRCSTACHPAADRPARDRAASCSGTEGADDQARFR